MLSADVLNMFLSFVLPFLVLALLGSVLVWTRKTWEEFRELQPDLAQHVTQYVRVGVEAAEQAGAAQLVNDKKTYAMSIAKLWLKEKGFGDVSVDLIAAEVERQVLAMKANAKLYEL